MVYEAMVDKTMLDNAMVDKTMVGNAMPDDAISAADTDIELKRLDDSVELLLNTINQLKQENIQLRSQQEFLQVERSRLMEKTETARTRVEAIINRLKAMENSG